MFSRWDDSSPPDRWGTQGILKWMLANDDSQGEIKNRVMSVVQTNDLDGHTLKQLAAEKDEIQDLFPSLKERLAFKSMLRKLFKDESQALQTDQQSLPKISPPTGPQPQRSFHGHGFTSALPQFHSPNPAPIQFFEKDALLMQSKQPLYHQAVEESNHRPVEKRPRLFDHTQTPLPVANSFSPGIQQSPRQTEACLPVYNHQKITSPQKRLATTNTTLAYDAPTVSSIPSINQPSRVKFVAPSSAATQSTLQISSVTTFAKTERFEHEPVPVHLLNGSDCWHSSVISQTCLSAQPQGSLRLQKSHIDYPAPLPEFTDELQELLRSCMGEISSSLRKMMVRESSRFYVKLTLGQRLNCADYVNIGRTMVEKYPGLACDEGNLPWALFNKSLSQSVRNLRRRIKNNRELGECYNMPHDMMVYDPIEISDDDAEADGDGGDGGECLFLIKEEIPA